MTIPAQITARLSADAPATIEIMMRSVVDAMTLAGAIATLERSQDDEPWFAEIVTSSSLLRLRSSDRCDLLIAETPDRQLSLGVAISLPAFVPSVRERHRRVMFALPARSETAARMLARVTQELRKRDGTIRIIAFSDGEQPIPRGVECDESFADLSAAELIRLFATIDVFCEVVESDGWVSRGAIVASALNIPTVTSSMALDESDGFVVRVPWTVDEYVDATTREMSRPALRSERFAAVFKTITSSLAL